MRDEGPAEAELDNAKTYLIGSFPLSLDTSERVATLLVEMQLEKLGIDYLEHRAAPKETFLEFTARYSVESLKLLVGDTAP